MITSSEGFLIATPTKCGTTTLESLAKRHARENPGEADLFRLMDWDSPRRQHRMCLPPALPVLGMPTPGGDISEWGGHTRYLFVRNPYLRYLSIYSYLIAPQNYSQWGAREVQGDRWPGQGRLSERPPLTFEQFLRWLARNRASQNTASAARRRGALDAGKAYRSPWVWTDSLVDSLRLLEAQPGKEEGEVEFLHLESLWTDLAKLLDSFGIRGEVRLGGLHSNRSTHWGASGASPGDAQFWGGIRCSEEVFVADFGGVAASKGLRQFFPPGVLAQPGCDCAACEIGVAEEARVLGYA